MRLFLFFVLIIIISMSMMLFIGCNDPYGACDPSSDYCSCQKDYDDCHEAECWEEEETCEGNKNCTRLGNCIEACKTDECPDECHDMYGDGEKDLKALNDCDDFNCGLCPR